MLAKLAVYSAGYSDKSSAASEMNGASSLQPASTTRPNNPSRRAALIGLRYARNTNAKRD